MTSLHVDGSRFPLVVATPPAPSQAGGIDLFYGEWDVFLARGRHAVLLDLRRVNPLQVSASLRKDIARHIAQRRAALARTLVAEARVVPGAAVRGLLTAIDWLVGDAFGHPIAYFGSVRDGEAWLRSRLQAEGLTPREPTPPAPTSGR